MEWLFMHWKYALCTLNLNGYMQSTGLELDSWRRRDFQMKISTRVSSKYFRIQQPSNHKSFGRWMFPKTRIGRQMCNNISRLFCICETFQVSDVKTCVRLQRHLSKCKHFYQEAEMNVHCSRTRQEIFRAKHFSKTY